MDTACINFFVEFKMLFIALKQIYSTFSLNGNIYVLSSYMRSYLQPMATPPPIYFIPLFLLVCLVLLVKLYFLQLGIILCYSSSL